MVCGVHGVWWMVYGGWCVVYDTQCEVYHTTTPPYLVGLHSLHIASYY
jgi:hypothetical protein